MFCSNCGCKLDEGVNFCPNCGSMQKNTENLQPAPETPVASQQKNSTEKQLQSSVKIGFVQAMKLYFENLFNFKGRATRSEFWWSFLFNIVVVGIALLLCKVFSCDDWDYFTLVPIILASSVSVRRLHDAGFFGFTVIVMLVCLIVVSGFDICGVENTVQDIFGYSFIGSALVLFILACKKSSQKENKWGENIRMQSEGQNAVPVMSKKALRNVLISIASTVAVFVVCIICQNVFYPSAGAVTSAEVAQSESVQTGTEQSAVQTNGHLLGNDPVGQWFERNGSQFYIVKKDKKNRIYLVVDKNTDMTWDRNSRVIRTYIYTDKGNYYIEMDSRKYAWVDVEKCKKMMLSTAISNKNLPFSDFIEVMTSKALETMVSGNFDCLTERPNRIDSKSSKTFISEFNGREVNGIVYYPYRNPFK